MMKVAKIQYEENFTMFDDLAHPRGYVCYISVNGEPYDFSWFMAVDDNGRVSKEIVNKIAELTLHGYEIYFV